MTNVTTVDFPDVNEPFKKTTNIKAFNLEYIKMLKQMNTTTSIKHADKLLEFNAVNKHIPLLKDISSDLNDLASNFEIKNHTSLEVKGRKKAWWEFNAKICIALLENGDKADLGLIRDILGFKFIVCHSGSEKESIELCYKLANNILSFFENKKQFTLLNAEKNINYNSSNELEDKYKVKVKDYYSYPKPEDNYRALHLYIQTPEGLVFEVQIILFEDDLRAEKTHQKHKTKRYANFSLDFDYQKIKFPKISFNENGELVRDYSGLFESRNIFEIRN